MSDVMSSFAASLGWAACTPRLQACRDGRSAASKFPVGKHPHNVGAVQADNGTHCGWVQWQLTG